MSAQSPRERRTSRRAERRLAAERAARRRRQLAMLGGAIVVALIAAIVLIAVNRPGEGTAAAVVTPAPSPALNVPVNGRAIGDPNAKVHVVEYGDFQ